MDPVFTAKISRRNTRMMLPHYPNDLFVRKSALPNRLSPQNENRLTFNRGPFRGAGQNLFNLNLPRKGIEKISKRAVGISVMKLSDHVRFAK